MKPKMLDIRGQMSEHKS